MKAYNLKFIVITLAFLLGVGSVWSIGGFSYLLLFFDQKTLESQVSTKIKATPPESDSVKTKQKNFLKNGLRFEDYPVSKIHKEKVAKLKIPKGYLTDSDWLKWSYKTGEVNFAGHYILTIKSCGMWCSIVDIIDAKTGKVYEFVGQPEVCFPHLENEFECNENFENIGYRIDSKLFYFFGFSSAIYDSKSQREKGFHYYKFENGKFTHLKSILVKEQRSARHIKLNEFDEGK